MCRRSRKPSVVIMPTSLPLCSSTMLVATVVPWKNISMSATSMPARSASTSIPSIVPIEGSWFVDGVLCTVTVPSSSHRTRSVNVPPTSTPIRFIETRFLFSCRHPPDVGSVRPPIR